MTLKRRVLAVAITFALGMASGVLTPRTTAAFDCGNSCDPNGESCRPYGGANDQECELSTEWHWWCLCELPVCHNVPCAIQ